MREDAFFSFSTSTRIGLCVCATRTKTKNKWNCRYAYVCVCVQHYAISNFVIGPLAVHALVIHLKCRFHLFPLFATRGQDARRHAYGRRTVWYVRSHNTPSSNFRAISKLDIAKYRCRRTNEHAIPELRVSDACPEAGAAECDAMEQRAVFADDISCKNGIHVPAGCDRRSPKWQCGALPAGPRTNKLFRRL